MGGAYVRANRKTPDMIVKNLEVLAFRCEQGKKAPVTDAIEYLRPVRDHWTMTAARSEPPTPHAA
jgi:hypothetical protein